MRKIKTVTNSDEIYFYFEMLNNVGARSVLDVGMFLKRIGAIARHVMSCELSSDLLIYGIDFFPEVELAVYQKVYDEIWTKQEFLDWKIEFGQKENLHFDVAVLLETDEWLDEKESMALWRYVLQRTDAVMTNTRTADEQVNRGMIRGYYPVSIGMTSYAWIPLAELRGER